MKKIAAFSFILLVLLACSKPSQEKLKQNIVTAEADLQKEVKPDNVTKVIKACEKYADAYPDDTMSPNYLLRAADLQFQNGQNKESADDLSKFLDKYPKNAKASYALYNEASLSEKLGDHDKAVELYTKFIGQYPGDPLFITAVLDLIKINKDKEANIKDQNEIADSKFKNAELYRTAGRYRDAFELYDDIYEHFTASKKRPESLFMMGFIAENEMSKPDMAKQYYEEFLTTFPNADSSLTQSVKFSLDHLGETPDQIIQGFEKKGDDKADKPKSK